MFNVLFKSRGQGSSITPWTVLGYLLAWGMVCAVAGAVPILLINPNLDYFFLRLGLAWAVHLVLACLRLWGFLAVGVHLAMFAAYFFAQTASGLLLRVSFFTQLLVSTKVVSMLAPDESLRPVIGCVVCFLIGLFFTGRGYVMMPASFLPNKPAAQRLST